MHLLETHSNPKKRLILMLAISLSCLGVYPGVAVIPGFTLEVEGERYSVSYTPSLLDFEYILTSPFVELDGMDYVPELFHCKGVVEIPWDRRVTINDFPTFAFFDDTPSTIGYLTGFAGNAGRTFTLTFIDLKTGRSLEMPNISAKGPQWIMDDKRPIGWWQMRFVSIGPGVLSLGGPRLDKCWLIHDGKAVRSPELEKQSVREAFAEIEFLPGDWGEFQKPLNEVDRQSAKRLLDYLYYGSRIGEDVKIQAVIERLGEELKAELNDRD